MEKNKMKKTVWGASVAVALTTSTALGVSAYQSGIDFHPSETEDTFRANQVRFDDNNDIKGRDNSAEQNESEFLEKDNNADEGNRPQDQNNADYLFEREQLRQDFFDSVALNDGTADTSAIGDNADSADTVYDFTDDRSQADVVLNGSSDDNIGGRQGDTPAQPTEPTEPEKPAQPTEPSKPSDDTTGGGETPDNTPTGTEPIPGYGDASLDPDTDKAMPSFWADLKDYPTDNPSEMIKGMVVIQQPDEELSTDSSAGLYSGQKNVTALTIFNALETYVQDGWETYNWGQQHFNQFVRIDAVWIGSKEYRFDSNQTIDIPADAESIEIDASYRLSTKDDWTAYDRLTYTLKSTRLLILNQALKNEGQKIEKSMLLNQTKDANPKVDEKLDLYSYQQAYLGQNRLNTLFPGWKENGEFVSWSYTVTAGRHVLEPAPRVSLDSSYEVYVKTHWYDTDTETSKLTYLQTLTGYNGKNIQTLIVPKYVQAVDMAKGTTLTDVNYLKFSDTVRYVNIDMPYMKVHKGYQVDAENPLFSATKNGILTDKSGTEYIGIPYDMTTLTIPEEVTKVTLPENTQIKKIFVETKGAANLPKIDYGGMTEGSVFVSDEILDDFVSSNGNALAGKNIVIRADSQVVKEDAIFSADETLLKSVMSIKSVYTVQNTVTNIAKNAFVSAPKVATIVLPNQKVTLEENCFAESNVNLVLCRTQTQADFIRQQLDKQRLSNAIRTLLLQTSKEGASYYIDGNETVLVFAEEGTTEFKGIETAQDGTKVEITAIAGSAFENNKTIQWVTLPEKVVKIGARAFYNCTALEGILIDTKDTITIENQAFDACPTLYFVASNAKNGNMDGYIVDIVNKGSDNQPLTQFVVTNQVKTGYTKQWQHFDNGYWNMLAVQDIGSTKMLYGLDEKGTPRIGIRSGKTLEGEVKLADTVIEIYTKAMFGTEGSFTLNWDELSSLRNIDNFAFAKTGLEGSVATDATCFDRSCFQGTNITELICRNKVSEVDESAFAECRKLVSVNWMKGFEQNGSLVSDVFYACDKLTRVDLNGSVPPTLILYAPGFPFDFNSTWTEKEEAEYINIHFLEEGPLKEQGIIDFVKAWRYSLLGFVEYSDYTAYQNMWYDVWDYEAGRDDEKTDIMVKEKLTESENRIRGILGVASVTEPTEFYPYRISGGYITLIGAPSNITSVFLGSDTLDIPDDWCLDYVGKGAFANTKNLESVMFDNGFAGFEQDAFQGVESDTLWLTFFDITPPALLLEEPRKPYSFGIDIEKLHINIYAFGDDSIFINYIEKWVYPLAGYEDYADMYFSLLFDAIEKEGVTSEEEIHAKMTEILLPLENKLRSVIWSYDMDFMPQVEHLSFTLGAKSDLLDTGEDEGEGDGSEGENTDLPDLPDGGDTDAGDTDNGDGGDTKDENQSGTDGADTADRADTSDSTVDTPKDNTEDTPADTDPAQEPIVLPDLVIERPVIVTIDIPLSALQTGSQTTEEPKEEPKDTPKDGEGESTAQGAEEGGAE